MPALPDTTTTRSSSRRIATQGYELRLSDSDRFSSWADLEAYLCSKLELEAASICLLPDFLASGPEQGLERCSIRAMDERSTLVEVGAGYRSRIVLHLCRHPLEAPRAAWPDSEVLGSLALIAREIYRRSVCDRVVDLMAGQRASNIAWLYLDKTGAVESASANASEFCRFCSARQRAGEAFLPSGAMNFVKTVLDGFSDQSAPSARGDAFALSLERGLVHCLIRRMAGEGYLLSLWRE